MYFLLYKKIISLYLKNSILNPLLYKAKTRYTLNMKNIAYIDGQNLYSGTKEINLAIDFKKFRIYLRDKYSIDEAYYFIGFLKEDEQALYTNLQKAGFIIVFKEHSSLLIGKKKGNVDADIIFNSLRKMIEEPEDFDKVLLVSGDGDYKRLVDYLISKDRFLKIIFPNKKFASSLYKKITRKYFDYIENIRKYIEYKPRNRK